MKLAMPTSAFTVGLSDNRDIHTIFLKGKPFAFTWLCKPGMEWSKKMEGKWLLNRQGLAIDLNLPSDLPMTKTLEAMVAQLDDWYRANKIQIATRKRTL